MNTVMIGGCDRSGTTLLGALLGNHSNCIVTPESQFKIDLLRPNALGSVHTQADVVLMALKRHWRFRIWNVNIDNLNLAVTTPNLAYPDVITVVVQEYARSVGKAEASWWVDHTPSNLKNAATLMEMFPQSKFIHIVRDGRAVAASVIPLEWGPNTIWHAAHWWLERVAYGLAAETCFSDRVIRIRYEDLVTDTETTLRRISDFLGLDYQPNMLFSGFTPPNYTAQQHRLVSDVPDASRTLAWQKELSPREVQVFEYLTGDFLRLLGYELKYGLSAGIVGTKEKLKYELNEFAQRQINKLRYRRRVTRTLGHI